MNMPVRHPITVYGVAEALPLVQGHSDAIGSFTVSVETHRGKTRLVVHSDYLDPGLVEFVDGFGATWELTR